MLFKYAIIASCLLWERKEWEIERDKSCECLWWVKRETIRESKEEEKSNQFILGKSVQRSYFRENVLFSYIVILSVVYLKYPFGFVIHIVGEENNALLMIGISKRTCGIPINYY